MEPVVLILLLVSMILSLFAMMGLVRYQAVRIQRLVLSTQQPFALTEAHHACTQMLAAIVVVLVMTTVFRSI